MNSSAARSAETDQEVYQRERRDHWDDFARRLNSWKGWGGYYHQRLTQIFQFLVPPGQRVLELGCAQGDLLVSLRPGVGMGVDFSWEMIRRASTRHPELRFIHADVHELQLDETFDVIVLSDLVNDLWDVQRAFDRISSLCSPRTRIILNFYSRLWEVPLAAATWLGLGKPTLYQNWLTVSDIQGLLRLTGFEVIQHREEILCPLSVPLLAPLANRYLVKLWPFKMLALTNVIVAQPRAAAALPDRKPLVSVVVPARNEAGNIPQLFSRMPEMGRGTEIVFVEGHSNDHTLAVIESEMSKHACRRCQLLRQSGKGKGDAVRLGFEHASGDVLMILDADLTVPPEDLPRFYEALCFARGEFVNGVRLVYPMERRAMRFINLLGNKFFSLAFSWLLGQPVKDTLCGTKVFWKSDYQRISENRAYFGEFDPFGDFDLLFGAAKLNLRIVEIPVRYRERTYGTTNIQRWKHGWLLLKMVFFAARKIKFV